MLGYTEEVKIGPKSQIVIPARIRNSVNVAPGDILIMTSDRNGRISLVKKPQRWASSSWRVRSISSARARSTSARCCCSPWFSTSPHQR